MSLGRQRAQLLRLGGGEISLGYRQRCTPDFFNVDSHARVPAHGHRHQALGVREVEMQSGAIKGRRERRPAFGADLELPLRRPDFRGVERQYPALERASERELAPAGFEVQALLTLGVLRRQQPGERRLCFLRLEMRVEGQPDIDRVGVQRPCG